MGAERVVIVIQTVEVGGHGADEIAAVLAPAGLAQFDAGDFGDGVPLVGGLERTAQEVFLLQRLRRQLGIDAGTAQEEQLFDPVQIGPMDEIILDLQVLEEELGRAALVGHDAAHPGGGDEDELRLFVARRSRATAALSSRSSSAWVRPSRPEKPWRRSSRQMALPARPRWPAT